VNNLPFPATPAMSRRFRLQWEDAQQCHVLLYPEGMVDQIVSGLETKFQATGLRADIESLLTHAYQHKWIE
jgi:pyrroloquinoline quinone biosynthesis protein D